jgi:DNA-binding CsgD family transcriptional regulator
MPKSQLRRLRGELADALATTGARRREDLLRLTSWQVGAGRPADPAMLTRAATRARSMFDMELAGRLATAAMASGGGVEAGLVLAVTHFATGAHDAADRLLSDLAAQCENDDERAAIANARAYNLSVLIGDPAASLTVLDAAMAEITDPIARLGLSARAASTMLFSGDPTAAIEKVKPALSSTDDMVASRSYYVISTAMALVGRTADAIIAAGQGLIIHRRCVEPNQIPEVQLIGATLAQLGAGATVTAADISATAYQACLEAGDKEGMASFSLLSGCVLIEQGKLADAARAFREGTAINRELSDTGALRWCLGGLAVAEGMARNHAAAAAAIDELDQLRADWMRVFSTDVIERGRAWALVAAGEDTAALRTLRAAAAQAAQMSQRIAEARLLHDVARLGEPGSVRQRLAELAELVDGELVAVLAEDASARSRHTATDLESVAMRFAGLGMFLLAAESAAAASAAYHEAGRSRPASACARMADEYAAIAGSALPARTESAELDQLTRREREIASLAAAGTSSKEIAGKLFISMRTVDNHLQRVYSKLGVNGRDQLRLALATDGAPAAPID